MRHSVKTGFFVALCGDKTPTSSGLFDLLRATYSWPCMKQGSVRSIPHTASVCPSALLIVSTYAGLTGNCFLLKITSLELSDGASVTRGMKINWFSANYSHFSHITILGIFSNNNIDMVASVISSNPYYRTRFFMNFTRASVTVEQLSNSICVWCVAF